MADMKTPVVQTTHFEPDPESHVQFQREIYGSLRKPKYSTKPAQWEAAGK
jgi:lactate 2-monooxygenase